ncbi:hypothetical protein D047_1559B, partial [Vibrio parahaemolyticus VPTS-2010_2]
PFASDQSYLPYDHDESLHHLDVHEEGIRDPGEQDLQVSHAGLPPF